MPDNTAPEDAKKHGDPLASTDPTNPATTNPKTHPATQEAKKHGDPLEHTEKSS